MNTLSFIILCPLVSALIVALLPSTFRVLFRLLALVSTFLSMVGAVLVFGGFESGTARIQFEEYVPWIHSLGIGYHVGVDGLNVGLVLMAAIVAFAAACMAREIVFREKEFYLLFLLMTGGILGAFASLDLFFLYFFHELALVPTFLMIGIWGRGDDRNYAAFKITIYLTLGALIALVGLIALYTQAGAGSFDIVELRRHLSLDPMSPRAQTVIFGLLLLGFGILVSLWPFHTWAPMAYAAAPTSTSMLHAGALKKVGLYGLLRVAAPMAPRGAESWVNLLALLCLGNLLYCGLVAMRQRDLNRLIGNSSVAHMGFVFLGIASLSVVGFAGAVVVMVAHGFLAALSFALSGHLRMKLGTLRMDRMGGLLRRMPFVGTLLVMAMFAACGLPGFANFPGEALVLFGAWGPHTAVAVLAAYAALVVGAVYALRSVRTMLHGPLPDRWRGVTDDLGPWHKLPFVLLLGASLWLGCYPRLLTDRIHASVIDLAQAVTGPLLGEASRTGNDTPLLVLGD